MWLFLILYNCDNDPYDDSFLYLYKAIYINFFTNKINFTFLLSDNSVLRGSEVCSKYLLDKFILV